VRTRSSTTKRRRCESNEASHEDDDALIALVEGGILNVSVPDDLEVDACVTPPGSGAQGVGDDVPKACVLGIPVGFSIGGITSRKGMCFVSPSARVNAAVSVHSAMLVDWVRVSQRTSNRLVFVLYVSTRSSHVCSRSSLTLTSLIFWSLLATWMIVPSMTPEAAVT
jgi:hypothetical protein